MDTASHPSVKDKISPIHWFPRTKKESYIERKIRLLQEEGGKSIGSLDETLEHAPSKLSRIEREKFEAKMAAIEATESRHAAFVEASWCRILDAAGIPSISAMDFAKEAESKATIALEKASEYGIVLRDRNGETAHLTGGVSMKDAILTAVSSVREVEREVVMAVKTALKEIGGKTLELCQPVGDSAADLSAVECTESCQEKHIEEADAETAERDADVSVGSLDTLKGRPDWQNLELPAQQMDANAEILPVVDPEVESAAMAEFPEQETLKPLKSLKTNEIGSEKGPSQETTPHGTPRTTESKSLQEDMFQRVESLSEEQRSALSAMVATRGLVNGLLDELAEVRELGIRRVSGGGLGDVLKKHISKLEAAKTAAMAEREAEAAVKGKAREVVATVVPEPLLVLKKPISRLERELEAAKKQYENVRAVSKTKVGEKSQFEGGLGDVMVRHKSKLEREKEAMEAARRPVLSESKHKSNVAGQTGGLGDVMVKHKSRLQRELEAAKAAGTENGSQRAVSHGFGPLGKQEGKDGLGDVMVKRMSRLEIAKMEAKQSAGAAMQERKVQSSKEVENNPWGGAGLGESMKKHVSRLEKAKAAWKMAEEGAKN